MFFGYDSKQQLFDLGRHDHPASLDNALRHCHDPDFSLAACGFMIDLDAKGHVAANKTENLRCKKAKLAATWGTDFALKTIFGSYNALAQRQKLDSLTRMSIWSISEKIPD